MSDNVVKRKNKKEENEQEYIFINKMYTGTFTENNIGHEIINFFKTDKNESYIYIVPHGCISEEYKKTNKDGETTTNIKYILFTSKIYDGNKIKILGKAEGLKLINKYNDSPEGRKAACKKQEKLNDIKYYNTTINNIEFIVHGEKNEDVYVTFKADKVFKLKEDKPIIISMNENKNQKSFYSDDENATIIKCNWRIGHQNTSLKLNEAGELKDIIENPDYWDDTDIVPINEKITNKYSNTNQFNFLKLILKEDDETIFTNMFYYYLKNNDKMLKQFIEFLNEKNNLMIDSNMEMKIEREKPTRNSNTDADERNKQIDECESLSHKEKEDLKSQKTKYIDLWIDSEKDIIIIENKIHSGLNGIDKEKELSQLDTYYQYAILNQNNRNIYAFIFVPNYNEEKIKKEKEKINKTNSKNYGGKYKIITYGELYEFFKSFKKETKYIEDKYYDDFLNAISKHKYMPSEEMERRFVLAIQNAKTE